MPAQAPDAVAAVAARMPRYHVRSLTGWPITTADSRTGTSRPAPTTWQVQDSWDNWRVVATMATGHWGKDHAERRADDLNFAHEQWLREQGLWP